MEQSISKESFPFSTPIQIRFSDIDGYLHVNNGIYFNYFEHSRADFLHRACQWDVMKFGAVVARVEMDYFRPIHLQDQVNALVRCVKIGTSSFVLEQYLVGSSETEKDLVFAKCLSTMVAVDMKTMKPVSVPENYRAKLLNQSEKQA